jgi:hypothetical protein
MEICGDLLMGSDAKMPDPAGVYAAKTLLPCRGVIFD